MDIPQLTAWPKFIANERANPAKLASILGVQMTKAPTVAENIEAVRPIRIISQFRKRELCQEQAAQSSIRVNILAVKSGDFENALIVDRPLSEDEKCDITGDLFVDSRRLTVRAAAI